MLLSLTSPLLTWSRPLHSTTVAAHLIGAEISIVQLDRGFGGVFHLNI